MNIHRVFSREIISGKYLLYFLASFIIFSVFITVFCFKIEQEERIFYLNSRSGNDNNDGLNSATAWKTLNKANAIVFSPGDKLLLCKGCTFKGKLLLKGGGSEEAPVIVSDYDSGNGENALPLINAEGHLAAVQLNNGKNFDISNLELVADAGFPQETAARTKRFGVWVTADLPGEYRNIRLRKLKIHHIFSTENVKAGGQNPTSNMGIGIGVFMENKEALIKNIRIEECSIEMTGHTGIKIWGFRDSITTYLDSVTVVNNSLKNIGGPGIVPGRCQNVLVRGNVVDCSGSSADSRMHARGSGIWPYICKNVLIEKNKCLHARGKNDSCGIHIDYMNSNVVVQYNLSLDNAGGFVEILGNDHNCVYRYNISINDGFRIKGQDRADLDGHVLWTTSFAGTGNKRTGPFNSYIYNNTIFVKGGSRSCFLFSTSTDGILIANNIFYILGKTVNPTDKKLQAKERNQTISNVVFTNNLYENADILPKQLNIKDNKPIIGDPGFKNSGGFEPTDYIPTNVLIVKDKGIKIEKLSGDSIGLFIGLKVEKDYFGNLIQGVPDIGAIEL